MTKLKLNKVKIVKKLSRQIKVPPARTMPSGKDKKKRSDWKRELKEQMEND